MRVSFIVPARNKERHVGACVRSVLAQTHPCDIYLSDQGSTDATRAVMADLALAYSGHHRVHVLDCPDTKPTGMPGLNAHLNWLNTQIQGDLVIMCSADDLNHPKRVEKTVAAFKEFNSSYVGTGVRYAEADGSGEGFTNFPERASRWLGVEETIRHQIGSCGSSAWARDLYQKHGPLVGWEQQDMVLPMMALAERGIYYVDEVLHTYVKHKDLANTGFQGRIAAARSDEERAALVEQNNFAHVRNWTSVLARWQQMPEFLGKLDAGAYDALNEKIAGTAHAWASVHEARELSDG